MYESDPWGVEDIRAETETLQRTSDRLRAEAMGDLVPKPLRLEYRAGLELADLLESLAPHFDPATRAAIRAAVTRKWQKLRALRAELELLADYDRRRSLAGHDYGAGQRARELTRYRSEIRRLEDELELSPLGSLADAWPTRDEKAAAFQKVMAPKLARVEAESFRRGSRPTEKTRTILVRMARVFGRPEDAQ